MDQQLLFLGFRRHHNDIRHNRGGFSGYHPSWPLLYPGESGEKPEPSRADFSDYNGNGWSLASGSKAGGATRPALKTFSAGNKKRTGCCQHALILSVPQVFSFGPFPSRFYSSHVFRPLLPPPPRIALFGRLSGGAIACLPGSAFCIRRDNWLNVWSANRLDSMQS